MDPVHPLSDAFKAAVGAQISGFLADQRPALSDMGPELAPMREMAATLLDGGKRLRPAFCFWGHVAVAGQPANPGPLLAAAASLDVLHVSALVHDDLMDASDRRRGLPSAHRQFEALHSAHGWLGPADRFGQAGAILLGDLLVMWSVEMLRRSGMPPDALAAADPIAEAMRTEVTCGQYLDVLAQVRPLADVGIDLAEVARVVEFKSARYSVQRPCQLGAALAGGGPATDAHLATYGGCLGQAFQFRDDLLGVFGDPEVTGKPAGDDLREGKRTVLVAHAYAGSSPAGQDLLRRQLGRPELTAAEIAELQTLIVSSGAREAVERAIGEGHDRAVAALGGAALTEEGVTALTALADAAVRRTF